MTADQFLDRDFVGLSRAHVTKLLEHWQATHGITVDGNATPETLESLEVYGRAERASDYRELASRALAVALSEIGNGEAGRNNRGADVYRYRKGDATKLPWNVAGPWCASFASYCYVQAANGLGLALPFRTSRSAKTLTERVAEAGREAVNPEPGALICWHRGRVRRRAGHVAFVVEYDLPSDTLVTVDGNKNRRGHSLATVEKFQHPNGRWRDRLYLMATIAPR